MTLDERTRLFDNRIGNLQAPPGFAKASRGNLRRFATIIRGWPANRSCEAAKVGALAEIEQLRYILMYEIYFQPRFGLLTNLLVQLLLSSYKLCDAMRCRRE